MKKLVTDYKNNKVSWWLLFASYITLAIGIFLLITKISSLVIILTLLKLYLYLIIASIISRILFSNKQKFKPEPKPTHKLVIVNTRPEYGENIQFLTIFHVITKDEEKTKEIFRKAFKEVHPTWSIKKITIERIGNELGRLGKE